VYADLEHSDTLSLARREGLIVIKHERHPGRSMAMEGDAMSAARNACAWIATMAIAMGGVARAQSCEVTAPAVHVDVAPSSARIGLALGSGSLHGLAHIGVLQAIEESGLPVHVVAGTSAGALVGSLWASGLPADRIEALATTRELENLARFAPASGGLMSNAPLRARLERVFAGRAIETWPVRFGAVATNADNGHARVLMSGDAALAVQASTASPVMFGPVTVNGERLADGALVEPVPVDAARAMGADFVIAVDVAYRPYEGPSNGIVQSGFQALNILVNSLGDVQAREADIAIRLDVHETLMRCGEAGVIAAGRDAMRRALPQVEAALRARVASR
jgi:NTE family protein